MVAHEIYVLSKDQAVKLVCLTALINEGAVKLTGSHAGAGVAAITAAGRELARQITGKTDA